MSQSDKPSTDVVEITEQATDTGVFGKNFVARLLSQQPVKIKKEIPSLRCQSKHPESGAQCGLPAGHYPQIQHSTGRDGRQWGFPTESDFLPEKI